MKDDRLPQEFDRRSAQTIYSTGDSIVALPQSIHSASE
jgi:hypothetical protein